MNKSNSQFWRGLKPGDHLVFNDQQTLANAVASKNSEIIKSGFETVIKEKTEIKTAVCEWVLFKCAAENKETVYFLVKIVDELFDLRLYRETDWINQGTKGDMVNQGHFFMFCPPADENNFKPKDLEYARSFALNVDGKDVLYDLKNETLRGESHMIPPQKGIGALYTEVSEYSTYETVETPEIIIIEMGGFDGEGNPVPVGGWVLFLEGWNLDYTDIETLKI